MKKIALWDITSDCELYQVPVYTFGYKFIRNLCRGMESPFDNWDNKVIKYTIPENDDPASERQTVDEQEITKDSDRETILVKLDLNDDAENMRIEQESTEKVASSTTPQETNHIAEVTFPLESVLPIITKEIPKRIFLGKDGDRDFYWEFGHPQLNNRHLLIFGNSGMGKTYAIQSILCEFGRQKQNSLIIDYTSGFLPNQLEKQTAEALKPCQRLVKMNKIPIDPFLKQKQDLGGGLLIENSSMDVAKRVTSIFNSVYNMGDQQTSILIDAIAEGVKNGEMDLAKLIPILESFLDDGVHKKSTVQTIISKLKPFVSEQPFSKELNSSWEGIFSNNESRCHIFQLAGVDKETSRILIEFILWDLYAYACNSSTEKTPKVIVLDEVQNLDQTLEAPLGKILTEGRKFGLCLIAATQTLSNLDKDQQARLFQAGHKLFFGPNAPEANQYAELVMQVANSGTKEQWKSKLMSLRKGECLSIGPVFNEKNGEFRTEVHKIKISSLADRGF